MGTENGVVGVKALTVNRKIPSKNNNLKMKKNEHGVHIYIQEYCSTMANSKK
jgi:hypothetical protein